MQLLVNISATRTKKRRVNKIDEEARGAPITNVTQENGSPILFNNKLPLYRFHRVLTLLYVISTQHHFSKLDHLNTLTFLQIK